MEDIKGKNSFLYTCVSCIIILLVLCYFGINTSIKGTAALTCASGTTALTSSHDGNEYCVPDDLVVDVGSYQAKVSGGSGGYYCTFFTDDSSFNCSTLGSGWTNPSSSTTETLNTYCEASLADCLGSGTSGTYTITYDCGSGATGTPPNSYVGQKNTNFTVPSTSNCSKTGYEFVAWKDKNGNSYFPTFSYIASTDLTLTAEWEELATYIVTYNPNAGTGAPSNQTKYHGQNLVLSSTKPTRSGYTFVYWNGSDGNDYDPGDTYTGNAHLTLIAQWTANKYEVTYDANGGTGAPSNQTKIYDQNLTLSSTKPTKSGYTFANWRGSDSKNYDPGDTYTGNSDLTLIAQWTANATPEPTKYTVSYSCGNGTGTPPSSQSVTSGSKFTVAANTCTRQGYNFSGWKSGSTSYTVGSSYTVTSNLTLTAQWTEKAKTTFTGKFYNGVDLYSTKTCTTAAGGKSCTMPVPSAPTKSGYTFIGWSTSESCTNLKKSAFTVSSDDDYYACFEKNKVVEDTDDEGNVTENKPTGEIAIALTWFMGLLAIGYAFHIFKSSKQN